MPCTIDAHSGNLPLTTPLWRYLDLWQFIDLLASKSLWFARADTLGDPFEFSLLLAPERMEEIRRQSAEFAQRLPGLADARRGSGEDSAVSQKLVAVNCWHIADTESDAMWRLHCPSGHGVAIRSSLGALQGALRNSEHDIRLGQVEYVTALPEGGRTGNIFHVGLYKRRAFEHERELRAILFPMPEAMTGNLHATLGKRVPVDPGAVVQEVRVHPLAPTPFEETVTMIVERIAPSPLKVERSEMLGRPYFGGPMFP